MKKLEIALLQMYCEPHRRYHGVNHILELLNLFHHNIRVDGLPDAGNLERHARNPVAIHWAILAHDCVYDPTRSDNEDMSAEVWRSYKGSFKGGWGGNFFRGVEEMVRLSKHHTIPIDNIEAISHLRSEEERRWGDAALFLSLDLSALAASPEIFHRNSDLIRAEYSHVADEMFMKGRRAFFEKMLARPYIYPHPMLEHMWGAKARENLREGIALLA